MEFRWNDWNVEHIGEHGVSPREAEHIVDNASPPYPEVIGDGKLLVVGCTPSGEYLQVVFIYDEDGTVYVIHARPLNDKEKRRYRRRSR